MASSLWIDTTPHTTYPPLDTGVEVDVCVIGAGICGLTAATLLKEAGQTVALIDMHRVGAGVSGYTTAKLSLLQELIYDDLRSKHGTDGAVAYAAFNQAALDWIAERAENGAIDCDFRRKPNFTYVFDPAEISQLESEVEAGNAAGVPLELVQDLDLPFAVGAAVRLDDQAEFHPRKFMLALAGVIAGDGSHVFERTRATGVRSGDPCVVQTDQGDITARRVIVASHYPFLDRGGFFARLSPQRSYCIGAHVNGPLPSAMYISADSPTRSIRTAPVDGQEILIVGGEGHKTGQGGDVAERYERLEAWTREHFDVVDIPWRWSAQDPMPEDRMPFAGTITPGDERILFASGFQKWGMTNGPAMAMVLVDRILGRENPWADVVTPWRFKPLAGGPKLIKENVNVAAHFFGDRLAGTDAASLDELAPGDGAIVRVDGERVAAFRDDDGTVHAVSPICTHLYCTVKWNSGERSWDCPCHGSRFAPDGTVLEGPATDDLARKEVG
jgi:glycine/D-amino acid oxidase-like deaminating enzyme/nitrite reductase/ring-hydroxylating ferredoxin subunit